MAERTPEQYAIEHAGYLATASADLCDKINALENLRLAAEESDAEIDTAEEERAIEALSDARRAVRNAVYEFEKRRDRCQPHTEDGENG